jgi:HK97 family phage prohead protease
MKFYNHIKNLLKEPWAACNFNNFQEIEMSGRKNKNNDLTAGDTLYLPALSEPKKIIEEKRQLGVTITTRERDREGDIVEPSGLNFENFLKNPVVLWAHDTSSTPVGKVCSISVFKDRVDAVVEFADTEHGRECFRLYRDRYLNAWSIGFIPRKWEPLTPTEDDPRKGFHISEAEVIELSAVPVPANPSALTRAFGAGKLELSEKMKKALSVDNIKNKKNILEKTGNSGSENKVPVKKAVELACKVAGDMMRRELLRAIAIAKGELGCTRME